MREIEWIRNHPLYHEAYIRLQKAEEGREFCGHTMEHFLDVARIAWILNLEQNLNLSKKCVYAMALLHDIGKYRQYEENYPHEKASAEIAEQIFVKLPENSFTKQEEDAILYAILSHRKQDEKSTDETLAEAMKRILYIADKKSRACYACKAEKECNWSFEKKNMEIEI